ncbi:right-handed parallel beta-helix repeat-containing protein [Sandarakinorhabdus sp.]|uniref:right-handed parallel beta-helix repeat-containing protein n=1 Tax=Sandarakinorhabdus sp. TaxID=1916663 RepID=UPI00286DB273|nr:right-handed parallel beta-helix repeat-containing protein [Sandarakinorhabdus sp.]
MPARQSHIHHALPYLFAVVLAGLARPADAAMVASPQTVTQSSLNAALKAARPGDTLVLSGVFSELLITGRDFGGVTIDARAAHFAGGVILRQVHNVTFQGGTYGSRTSVLRSNQTIDVTGSSNISFRHGTIVGDADGRGTGLLIRNSQQVTVRDSQFEGHRTALAFTGVTSGLLTRNNFVNMSSDGINITDSHKVIASYNSCSGFNLTPTAHPDCIQMWSLSGKPMQSDLYLLNNRAVGAMQGFASFDPKGGSGERLTFAGNYVESHFPQGIACYGCFDSRFLDNVLIAEPGARWRTSMNIIGGAGNTISGNQILDWRKGPGLLAISQRFTDLVPSIAGVGSRLDNRGFGASAVPEPAIWAQFIIGFMVVGLVRRGRHSMMTRAC